MPAAGTWTLSLQTPLGEYGATLALAAAGDGTLTGTLTSTEGNSTSIHDGTINGAAIAWTAAIKSPMPLTLQFSARIEGDAMTGTVAAAGVGTWPFTGARA